ncbi:MAG: hypothetical protein M9962_11150 [Oligoflexia bacterium]|nr:hypothetical protein [Oligoflexia bacterium]
MEMSLEQNEQYIQEPRRIKEQKVNATEEVDLQGLFENYNYYKPLDPREFSVSRDWYYSCRICGGETKLSTKHPYCCHCGFSQRT